MPSEQNRAAAVSSRQAQVDGPGRRNSGEPGGEPDQDGIRESKRHSTGEVERHQAEERRVSELKKSIREQEDKVEERRKGLAAGVRDQLFAYAVGLDDPDNPVKVLHPQYIEAKRELGKLQIGGLSEKHPTAIAQIEKIETIRLKLDEAVGNLKGTAKAQFDQRAIQLEAANELPSGEVVNRGFDTPDYIEAQRDFEVQQRLLQQMKLILASERQKSPGG